MKTYRSLRLFLVAILWLPLLLPATRLSAQVYEKVFSFTQALSESSTGGIIGYSGPSHLLEGPDGNLYGTAHALYSFSPDAPKPTIFRMSKDGHLSHLYTFPQTSGLTSVSLHTIGLDRRFYGTTLDGGTGGFGTVFAVTGNGNHATLVDFGESSATPKGRSPTTLFQGPDGYFYGTTERGGIYDCGTVFKMTASGGLTTLVHFSGQGGTKPGRTPTKLFQARDGTLYGMTIQGGSANAGTLYKLTTNGAFESLVRFTGNFGTYPGSSPQSFVQSAAGDHFYGTTFRGGNHGYGTLFMWSPQGELTTLHHFEGSSGSPVHSLQQIDGTVFGVTGAPGGSLYQWNPTNGFQTTFHFASTWVLPPNMRMMNPSSGLLLGANGEFYGTTDGELGFEDEAVIYRVAPGGIPVIVNRFTGDVASNSPFVPGNLIQGSDGVIYGTTREGGNGRTNGYGEGTIFKVSEPTGIEILAEFGIPMNPSIPVAPHAAVIPGLNGDPNFYGTSTFGGIHGLGTVFKVTPSGELTTLGSFGGNDSYQQNVGPFTGLHPVAELVDDGSGSLLGVTTSATGRIDSFNSANVFRISTSGHATSLGDLYLYDFRLDQDKQLYPRGALTLAADGNFYGTLPVSDTYLPVSTNSVYRMSPDGQLAGVAEFGRGTSGFDPGSKLLELDLDGTKAFYGTTLEGGNSGDGTIYRVTPGGNLSYLASLYNSGGKLPSYDSWQSIPITSRNGPFTISFRIKPGRSNMHGVTGLALGAVDDFTDLACVVRLNPGGYFDARNGGVYQSVTQVPYSGGVDYIIVMTVNPVNKTYSVTVNGTPIAANYAFRTEQAGISQINTLAAFSVSESHVVSQISDFSGRRDGSYPLAGLTFGSDGNFYGMAAKGGAFDHGTVFRVTPQGSFTKLLDFTGDGASNKGSVPVAALVEHKGFFYGTTSAGGGQNLGTIFRMTSGGVLETLFDFDADAMDSVPLGRLVKGYDGNLYGTTKGANEGAGGVYRLVFPGDPVIYPVQSPSKAYDSAIVSAKFNPRGNATEAWLDYAPEGQPFQSLRLTSTLSGHRTIELARSLGGLIRGVTYSYRFRAQRGATVVESAVQTFETVGPPTVVATAPTGVRGNTATFNGTVRAGNATTMVNFQYGTDGTTFPFSAHATPGVVNGSNEVIVSTSPGLSPGTTYYYRLVATNEITGTNPAVSEVRSFTTLSNPVLTIGGSSFSSTTSARVMGTVNARGSQTQVVFEFWTGGETPPAVPPSVPATTPNVGGESDEPVAAVLANLSQGTTYYYRLRASVPGTDLAAVSEVEDFTMDALSGFNQGPPAAPPPSLGFVIVNLTPSGIGEGWRFAGEQQWRPSGIPAFGLTTGDRIIEFRPINGFLHPEPELITIISGGLPKVVNQTYETGTGGGSGGIKVKLKPDSIADEAGRWRLFKPGENFDPWLESGATIEGLAPGNYLIECKPVDGRTTPPPATELVEDGIVSEATLTYFLEDSQTGARPVVLPFETVNGDSSQPYRYVGQIRSDVGASSGFVVKPRVVATAGHVVFDEENLSVISGLQWLFQRDSGAHEPKPQIPRGVVLLDGYAAAREGANPGEGTPRSQNRDAAALYFLGNAGRGGFSGFLASDSTQNEFLESNAAKILAGYPVDDLAGYIPGRMHATPPVTAAFARILATDESGIPYRTYTTATIRGSGGMSGGPLCVRFEDGAYYPAAIYLGGSAQTVVRAIDSSVIQIFNEAELASAAGDNDTGGGISFSSFTTVGGTSDSGAIKVTIQPAAARTAGAVWRLKNRTDFRGSGSTAGGLDPSSESVQYILQLNTIPGFHPPVERAVSIKGGKRRDIVFTYDKIIPPPVITSPAAITGTRGQTLNYQIAATNSPTSYSMTGTLPAGLSFSTTTGLISGQLQQAGVFNMTLRATNSGGTGSLSHSITSRPSVSNQNATLPLGQPFTHAFISSESGTGTTYVATDLPAGVSIHETTGSISGTTLQPGIFTAEITVSKGGASAKANFTLTITGTPLDGWRLSYFSTTENSGEAADGYDADGDGQTNLEEYAAGTDPKNGSCHFKIQSAEKDGSEFTVTLQGMKSRTYVLEVRENLGSGPWTDVAAVGPLAANGEVSLSDPDPPSDSGFYRVRVSAP